MQAWKRKVITYQIANASALVVLIVGAVRFATGQAMPPEPVAPPAPAPRYLCQTMLNEEINLTSVSDAEIVVGQPTAVAESAHADALSRILCDVHTTPEERQAAIRAGLAFTRTKMVLRYEDADRYIYSASLATRRAYTWHYYALAKYELLKGDVARAQGLSGKAADAYAMAFLEGAELSHGTNFTTSYYATRLISEARQRLWSLSGSLSRDVLLQAQFCICSEEYSRQSLAATIHEEMYAGQVQRMNVFRNRGVTDKLSPHENQQTVWYLPALYTVWSKQDVMTAYNRYMEAEQAQALTPYHHGEPDVPLPNDIVNQLMLPIVRPTKFQDAAERTQNRLLLATFVLRQYHKTHGRYPNKLQDLAWQFQGGFIDPFAQWREPKAFLRYRRTGNGYVLYSIGTDGVDDSGRAVPKPAQPNEDALSNHSQGDIVAGVNL